MKRVMSSFLTALVIAMLPAAGALAADYPSRPIRLIVPYPPGGTSEVLARTLAQKMSEGLKQTIYIDNIGGAGSTIGSGAAARATPDGYTLLFGYSSGLTMAPGFYSKLPYDTLKSFTPVGAVASFPMVMTASAAVPADDLKQLVALAKREPGKLTYGTAGKGSSLHLLGEILHTSTGIDIVHVPYKGMAPAWLDVAAGRIDLAWDAPDGVKPLLDEAKIKALAVTSDRRLPSLPKVPTVAEQGFPELQMSVWTAILAPAGVPPEVVTRLEAELQRVLALPEVRALYESRGYQMMDGSSAHLGELMKSELARYGDVIRRANAQID